LLHAIAGLSRDRPRVTGLIVGEGPERAGLEALAASLGLGNRVRFTGSLDTARVFGHLKSARVMVLPSVREGFGIAVLEAQAAGAVPIVVRSPTSAAPDLIRDGVDGLVCEASAEALAGAIRQLLSDAPERAALARLASETWALPLLLTLAVAAGIGFVSAITPISGRGDFGQWLMTSRYYLGQGVPSYRVVTDLPPLVPALLAVIRIGIQDPAIALQTLNILVLLGLALSFFAVGAVLLDDPIGGLLSAVV